MIESNTRSKCLKRFFPFRLGTTSYIIADDIIPNVIWLSDIVDDIELVLFETDNVTNLPDENNIEILRSLSAGKKLSYTVHFPLDLALCSTEESLRRESVTMCERIIKLMEPLNPFAYIVHCNEGNEYNSIDIHTLKVWRAMARESFKQLTGFGVAADRFAVETLGYPFSYIDSVVEEHNMSICLDIGHLIMNRYSLREHYERYWDRTRVIHLHGIVEGKDHASLDGLDRNILDELMTRLKTTSQTERVVTIEVFSESDLNRSLAVLRRYCDD